jgi:putative transposase
VCDSRVFCSNKTIKNKLTLKEKEMILEIANSAKFRDLPPCKIVPLLADEGRYIESRVYVVPCFKRCKTVDAPA